MKERNIIQCAVTKGRINQSVAKWCFEKYWDIEKMCQIAKALGCKSVELIAPEDFAVLKKHGLICAIAFFDNVPDPPFSQGWNNPKYHDRLVAGTKSAIDTCAKFGSPAVIAFTGYVEGIPDDAGGATNCVAGLKRIAAYAEKKKVNVCLEILNTRDDTDPMKGHPGYQGDHTDYCVDIIRRVSSPRVKLLFDIYHVQIMDGDIIRRIRQYQNYIGHYHVAGSPGRNEIDESQEINFPAVMNAIVDTGFTGFVGQEFIPTLDPLESLKQAVELCDV